MSPKSLLVLLAAIALVTIGGHHEPPPPPAPTGGAGPAGLRLPLTVAWVLTQPYGCTPFLMEPVAPWCPTGHFHSGIDMAAPAGTTVHAAAGGVAQVAWMPYGYGLYVVIDHGGGLATLYGHLAWTPLHSGAVVSAGDEVGLVGSTGLSTGPHLHFEARRSGRPVDPRPLLPR